MNQPTPEELKVLAEEYGNRIAFYLQNLDIPAELKLGLIELIPHLTGEQIDALHTRLEDLLATQIVIEKEPEYREKMRELHNKTSDKIDALLAELE